MSGAGIATDGTNLYVVTGNGAFNGDPSNFDANGFPLDHDYGNTVLKLTPDPTTSAANQNGNGWGLKVSDYFTPSNQYELNALDLDLGSGGATLLPDNVLDAAGDPMLVVGGKESRVYLIDRNNLGKFNYSYPTGATTANPAPYDRVVGEYANDGTDNGGEQIYASAAYYDGNVYIGVHGVPALELNVSALASGDVTPVKTNLSFGYPGETFQISADGDSDGIAWAENPGGSDLLAYNAANFTTPIYDSNTNSGDALGGTIHFHVPTIANGMVYAGSRGGGLGGYGLKLSYLTSNPSFFSAPTNLSAVWASATDAYLTWTSNSSLATEFRVDRAPLGTSNWSTIAYVGNSNSSYNDTTMTPGTAYQYRVVAISGANASAPSLTAAPAPTVVSVTTNDGDADGNTTQASEVRQLVVTFSQAVNLTQPGAFSLGVYNLNGTGGAVSGNGANDGSITDISSVLNTATSTDGGLIWTITFAPSTANTDASASLIDGIYSFSINNADVTSNGVALTGSNTYTFHRLYGDVTGAGAVNNVDARDFSEAYGAAAGSANYNAAFDFGGAGDNINNTDARDFSLRYGQSFSSVLPAGGIN